MKDLDPLVPHPMLPDQVADALRQRIVDGDLVSGEHLVETKIAQALGVSRGPVREALVLLRAEGLVREEPRRGSFVVSLSPEDVRDIYDLRAALEVRAARLVIARAGSELPELRHALEEMRLAAEAGRIQRIVRADLQFHATVVQLTGNARLNQIFQSLMAILRPLTHVDEGFFDTLGEIHGEHQMLLDVLESGNVAQAESLFDRHVLAARDRVVRHLGKQQPGARIDSERTSASRGGGA